MRPGALFAWLCAAIVLGGLVVMVILKLRTGTSPTELAVGTLMFIPGLLMLVSLRSFREQFRLLNGDHPTIQVDGYRLTRAVYCR